MSTLIQEIEIEWTKASRGAPRATIRNAVPEVFPFGNHSLGPGVFVQKVKYTEFNDFSEPTVKRARKINENQIRHMKLVLFDEEISVEVHSWGIPLRNDYSRAKKIGRLYNNTWLKIVGNSRIVWEYTWAYHKYVYNIFFGNPQKFDELILTTEPVGEYRDEINLW